MAISISAVVGEYLKHFPDDSAGAETIYKAGEFARKAHRGQKRKSGHDYFEHTAQVALTLALWRLDWQSVASGFLHDVVEDCDISAQTMEETFGPHVRSLVEGVTKIGSLRYGGEKESAESLRKMILATSKDLRVIFIKLADRLHNMQTLSFLPAQKQKKIALETFEIYAPLADRLGMQNIYGELSDLAFPYLNPPGHSWIVKTMSESYEEREKYLRRIEPIVRQQIERVNVQNVAIDYRAKRHFSLYKKLVRFDMNLDQIYDLIAMRILVPTIDDCYTVLGTLHQLWPPMPGRIKDYIAMPKPNGYQSLHTTVFCVDNRPTEFQIRTHGMHEYAERGAAAHWLYESKKGSSGSSSLHDLSWINQLQDWQRQFPGSEEFVSALKVDLFSDRIFVLSPKGRVLDLPIGSTPLDFAYKIHTDIGSSCVGARINNKIVSLDTPLQSGDMVEIITQKNRAPSAEWTRIVKTQFAKKKIRAAINRANPRPKKTEYKITSQERMGLLKDISVVISRNHVSIVSVSAKNEKGLVATRIIVDVANKEKAENLMLKLKKVEGVKTIAMRQL